MKKGKAHFVKDSRAVSPVIGVVLMVALTIILASIVGLFMSGMIGTSIPEHKDVQIYATRINENDVKFVIISITPIETEMTELLGEYIATITDKTKLEVGDTFMTNKNTPVGTYIILTATFDDGTTQVIFASKV